MAPMTNQGPRGIGRELPENQSTWWRRSASKVRLVRARAAHRVRLAGRRRRQMVAGAPELLLAYLRAATVAGVALGAVAGVKMALSAGLRH